MLSPHATQMETFTGQFVDLFDPDPSTINLRDIAHQLALQCRYNGAVKRFYSIAEHSVLVAQLVEVVIGVEHKRGQTPYMYDDIVRGALLHDASEAYLSDAVSPLKYALRMQEWERARIHLAPSFGRYRSAFDILCEQMDKTICRALDFDQGWLSHGAVQLADMWALKIEAKALTASGGSNWRWQGELPNDGELPSSIRWYGGLDAQVAEQRFVDALSHYCGWEL